MTNLFIRNLGLKKRVNIFINKEKDVKLLDKKIWRIVAAHWAVTYRQVVIFSCFIFTSWAYFTFSSDQLYLPTLHMTILLILLLLCRNWLPGKLATIFRFKRWDYSSNPIQLNTTKRYPSPGSVFLKYGFHQPSLEKIPLLIEVLILTFNFWLLFLSL